jgi:DNA mismatch repair protein MSH6
MINMVAIQLYEEDARTGHREFDLKLTQRVKMSMVGSL